ncbi:MAG: superoxide dismutase, partial [Candidatus Magasanikbacteria bacterium RIFCSPLOWO2_02_FULL_43_22]
MNNFDLQPLHYSYDALEPYLDAKTLEIHYTKHHQAYRDNFVKILEKYPALLKKTPEDILRELNNLKVEETDRIKIKNHGGGFVNHNIFWSVMGLKKEIDEKLIKKITETFGSVEQFKQLFNQTAIGHFGSGWVWLVEDEKNQLKIYSLPNQDSPLTLGHTPILTL